MSADPAVLVDFATAPRWVAWRNEMRNGQWTKVPYCSATRQAEADDASTWLPHDQAVLIADAIVNGSGGGIGIELGQCGERWIVGVDLDTCRDPVSGIVEPWASEIIDRLESYAEVSPSQTGVKQFFLIDPADVPELRHIMGTDHGRQFKRANGSSHPPSIEFYLSNRYFTVTWEGLADAPADLRVVPLEDLRWLIEEVGPTFSGKDERKRGGSAETDTILGRLNTAARHNKAIDTALRNAATLAGGSRSEGALGLGAALKRAGWSFEDMKAALRACPATRDWAGAADERQFERIWARSDDQATGKPDTGPAAASAPRNKLFDPWAKLNSPTLPKNALPAVLQAFVEDRHELMGADIGALAWSAISASSAAIDGSIRLQMKTHDKWHITPNIWVSVIGPPSSMKTPIINAAWKPLVHAQKHYMDEWKRRLADWKAAPKKERDDDMPVPTVRFVSNDATIEAIQDILSRQNRGMGYLRDELAGWICQFEKYGSNKAGGADRASFSPSMVDRT